VPRDLSADKCITDIRLCPLFADRGDDPRFFLETARRQRDIGGDANVDGRNVLRNPVVGRVCVIADQNHSHVRGIWRPNGPRAVGDDENIEPKARRHAVDFLPHRARITIDVDLSQLLGRFPLKLISSNFLGLAQWPSMDEPTKGVDAIDGIPSCR
jgi:hypothetical protein